MIVSSIVKRPIITEKSTRLTTDNKYCFEVSLKATKDSVANAVSSLYKVDVLGVETIIVPGKSKRVLTKRGIYVKAPKWKKAIVRIKEGQKIPLFDLSEEKK